MGELMGTRVFEGLQKLLTAVSDKMRPASLEMFQDFCSPLWVQSPVEHRLFGQAYSFAFSINSSYLSPKSNVFFFFFQWKALDMTRSERRKILCSVSFHVIAITCVVWSLWVLIERTAEEIKQGQLNWPFWTKLVVVAIGFTGGLVFMYVQCKVYVQLWKRLKAFNRIILVKDVPPPQEGAEYI